MRYTLLRTMTAFDHEPAVEVDWQVARRKVVGAVP
jgi:hypothetical protein